MRKILLKGVSLLTFFCFFITQTAFGNVPVGVLAPAQADTVATSNLLKYVAVSDIYSSRGSDVESLLNKSNESLVVYIEDAHGNFSAQRNIASAIEAVSTQNRIESPWIALEGTTVGEVDHRVLSAFPQKQVRKIVTEYFLRKGDLDGADYYASIYNNRARLFGVDSELVKENRATYQNYLKSEAKTKKTLEHLRKITDFLKKKVYHGDLIKLDRAVSKFDKNSNGLLKHLKTLEALAKKHKLNLTDYPNLSSLIKLKTLEAKITQKGLEKDKRAYSVKRGIELLNDDGILALQSGNSSAFDSYRHLQNYARFLQLQTQLEGVPVFEDVKMLTNDLWKVLLTYEEAENIYQIDSVVKFYEKLFDFSLLPEDYQNYLTNSDVYQISNLKERIADYNFLLRPKKIRLTEDEYSYLAQALQDPLSFYNLAERRDGDLIANLLDLKKKNPNPKTFFIAGGFHRDAITQSLKEKEISYIVLSPKITDQAGSKEYWERMKGDSVTSFDLALTALSTVKEEQKIEESFVRRQVQAMYLLVPRFLDISADVVERLVAEYRGLISKADRLSLDALLGGLSFTANGAILSTAAGQQYVMELVPSSNLEADPSNILTSVGILPDKSFRVTASSSSLGSEPMVSVDMDQVRKKLEDEGIDPNSFQPSRQNISFGQKGIELNYAAFRDQILKYVVERANAAGLEIDYETQKAMFDAVYSFSEDQENIDEGLRLNFKKDSGILVEFNNETPFLFTLGETEEGRHFIFNTLALQSIGNPHVRNALFGAILLNRLMIGRKLIEDREVSRIFYKMMNVSASSDAAKKSYYGGYFTQWASSTTRAVSDNVQANRVLQAIFETHQQGFAEGMILLNHIRIDKYLARGGMGATWKATDLNNGNTVVVKQMFDEMYRDEGMRQRFYREIDALRKNRNNPNVAKLILMNIPGEEMPDDIEPEAVDEKRIFYVMEWAPGKELSEIIPDKQYSAEQRLEIMQQIAEGVERIHNTEIAHKDLKPDNMKVDEYGFPRVLDFGLAKPTEEGAEQLTMTGMVVGTPLYMSPEQVRGDVDLVSYPSDIFALGSIFYEMMTGRTPFTGQNVNQIIRNVGSEEPHPMPDVIYPGDEQKDQWIRDIIFKALEKKIEDRYQSAADMAADIKSVLRNQPPLKLAELVEGEEGYISTSAQTMQKMAPADLSSTPKESRKKVANRKVLKKRGAKKPSRRKAEPDQTQPKKSRFGWYLGGGAFAAIATAIVGVFAFSGGEENTPAKPDQPKTVVEKPEIEKPASPEKSPEEIAAEKEVQRLAGERKKIAGELKKIEDGFVSVARKGKGVDAEIAASQKALVGMEAGVKKAEDNLADIEVVVNVVAAAKTDGKEVESSNKRAQGNSEDILKDLKNLETKLLKLQANPDLSDEQRTEIAEFLKKIEGERKMLAVKRKKLEGLVDDAQQLVKDAETQLKIAEDPATQHAYQADALIEKIENILPKLPDVPKGLEEPSKLIEDLLEVRDGIGDKYRELTGASATRTSRAREGLYEQVIDAMEKLAKSKKPKKSDVEKLRKVQEEGIPKKLKELDEAYQLVQTKETEFKELIEPILIQVEKLGKALADLEKLKGGSGVQVAEKIEASKKTLEEAKRVTEAVRELEGSFKKAQARTLLRIYYAKLKVQAWRGEYAISQVEVVWQQNRKVVEERARERVKTREEREAQRELKAAIKELKALIKAYKDKNGSSSLYTGLFKKPKSSEDLVGRYKEVFETKFKDGEVNPYDDQAFLAEVAKIFEKFGIDFDISYGEADILWRWNGKDLKDFIFYHGSSQVVLRKDAYDIEKDGKRTFFSSGATKLVAAKFNDFLITEKTYKFREKSNLAILAKISFPEKVISWTGVRIGFYDRDNLESPAYYYFSPYKNEIHISTGVTLDGTSQPGRKKVGQMDGMMGEEIDVVVELDAKKKTISLFVGGELIDATKLPENFPFGDYSGLLGLDSIGAKKPKVIDIKIKGKSLGVEIGKVKLGVQNINDFAVSASRAGVRFFQYQPSLIKLLTSPDASQNIQLNNLGNIIVFSNKDEMDGIRKRYQSKKQIYPIAFVYSEKPVSQLTQEGLQDLVVASEPSSMFSRIGIKKSDVNRFVVLSSETVVASDLTSESLSDAKVVPFKFDTNRFSVDQEYRNAYFLKSAAVAKGDNDVWGLKFNRDGTISILNELMTVIAQQWDQIVAIARAA